MSEAAPYLATVVAHYRHPRNRRALGAPTHVAEGVNALCGDRVRLELTLDGDRVHDAAFSASACAIATAAASLLTERARGAALTVLRGLSEEAVLAELGEGIPAPRHGCATLPLRVLREALGTDA